MLLIVQEGPCVLQKIDFVDKAAVSLLYVGLWKDLTLVKLSVRLQLHNVQRLLRHACVLDLCGRRH